MNKFISYTVALAFCMALTLLIAASYESDKELVWEINSSTTTESFLQEVDSLVRFKMREYQIPGLALGLIVEDSVVYTKGFGVKSIKTLDVVTENSNFHTASISKLFTAQAIMMLIEKDMLSLDDRLVDIVPQLNYTDKLIENITIRSLLNHTSGLPDVSDYHWEHHRTSEKSLEDYILGLKLKLKSEPGTQYYYSNLSYDILGYIVERLTLISFEAFVKKNILNPSGMTHSDFRYFNIPDSLKTSPHTKNKLTGNVITRKIYPYTREHAPSSTLNSSVFELSLWMISFLKDMDSPEHQNGLMQMVQPSSSIAPRMGLGFQLRTIGGKSAIGHFGGDRGYRSYLSMIPDSDIGLVVLANCDYNEDFRQEIIHPIAERMLVNYGK